LEQDDITKVIKDFSKNITKLLFKSNKDKVAIAKELQTAPAPISSELSPAKASKIVERVRKIQGKVEGDKPMITTSVVSPVKQIKTHKSIITKVVSKAPPTRKTTKPKGEKEN
jgi:hypothetical protein